MKRNNLKKMFTGRHLVAFVAVMALSLGIMSIALAEGQKDAPTTIPGRVGTISLTDENAQMSSTISNTATKTLAIQVNMAPDRIRRQSCLQPISGMRSWFPAIPFQVARPACPITSS